MSPVAGITPATSPLPAQATPTLVQRSSNPAPYGWQVLTVRAGDNLSDIAITHRTTVGVLLTANRIHDGGNFLAVGQHLSVPRTKPAPRKAAPAAQTATYVVRSGDTLGGIAASYKVSLATLYSLNRISRTAYIQPGQRINVPAPAASARAKAAAAAAVTTTIVTVRSGDTLSDLAVHHKVSVASLLKANNLSLRSILQIGQKIKVVTPKKATSSNTFAGRTYSATIVNAAAANRAYLTRHTVPSRTQIRAMIVATARRHGVDPNLALAISWQESGWNQRQVSVANAIGAMQVIPSSGVWASELAGRKLNLLNAQDNITAGVIILRSLTRSASTQSQAIAGYYQGLYSVQKSGMYTDTKHYVASILALSVRV
ncbi:MAG TPA: LysM peptidoglycan-binding domain-containing protein [Dermatophilaceae bacterium]|jgi:LysM repeat protein